MMGQLSDTGHSKQASDDESDFDSDMEDSDKELQIALKEGLLKGDNLNFVTLKKRPIIYKKEELREKLRELKKDLPWIETLDITVPNESNNSCSLDDDFEREIIFYKQAQSAAREAVSRLEKLNLKFFRPSDYYAQMAKTDEHMQKVRKRLADLEEGKKRQEAIKRIREEKKFAAKVRTKSVVTKSSEKKQLVQAVNMHRKGMKSQLEMMLNNAKRLQDHEGDEMFKNSSKNTFGNEHKQLKSAHKKLSRFSRDKKFGFGGQKKRSKKNNEKSFNEFVTPGTIAKKLNSRRKPGSSSKGFKQKRSRK